MIPVNPIKAMTRLMIVRHGETDESLTGSIRTPMESKDDPLNRRGREQAAALANYLCQFEDIAKIYTSPLKRAVQTAEIISQAIQVPYQIYMGLNEVNLGVIENLDQRERLALWEKSVASWKEDATFSLDGGESLARAGERFATSLWQISAEHPNQRVVVISHQGAIAFGLSTLLESDPRLWARYLSANCAITEIELKTLPQLIYLNNKDHLIHVGTSTWQAASQERRKSM
jgi:broad specificity phosphatase PhoE